MVKITEKQIEIFNQKRQEENSFLNEETFELYLKGENPFKNIKRLFHYKNFFQNSDILHIYYHGRLERLVGTINEGHFFKSIKDIKVSLTLEKNLKKTEIIERLGGEENISKKVVSMDQIQLLIEKQKYGHKKGKLSINGNLDIFFTKTVNEELIMLRLSFYNTKWHMFLCEEEILPAGSQILQDISLE